MQIDLINVSKRYANMEWLFRHVNMRIQSGDIIGLLGPSGCGKSTLCRIIAGYEAGSEGEVLLDGKPLPKTGYRPVQLLFQHPERAVNPRWRIGKIITEGWAPDQELLESLDIQMHWLTSWPSELSGGELQRICIARALAPQTRFLIADEMTTMLDAITQAMIWKTVLGIAERRNMGLLVVSHDKHLLHRICTSVIDFSNLRHC